MEGEAPVAIEPGAHLRMLVGGVVVEDHVDALARRELPLDSVEEADELLMAVALHVAADHGAIEHVERGEQQVLSTRNTGYPQVGQHFGTG